VKVLHVDGSRGGGSTAPEGSRLRPALGSAEDLNAIAQTPHAERHTYQLSILVCHATATRVGALPLFRPRLALTSMHPW
jgi:hypothetical protein